MTDPIAPDVYLTWNDSTRSKSLARLLSCERVLLVPRLERGAARHVAGGVASGLYLLRRRPRTIWYQYSLVLGAVLALYRLVRRRDVVLVADIHTKALRRSGSGLLRGSVAIVKRWSLRMCRAVLVSNDENARYARFRFGIDALVLPDPMPIPPPAPPAAVPERTADVVFVCSFAADEPLDLIAETVERVRARMSCAVTGNVKLLPADTRDRLSHGARLTDFLPESTYWDLLRAARCVVVLSSEPACLPCGAYEAIAVGHRPVVADDPHARATFAEAAIYTPLSPDGVNAAITEATAAPPVPDPARSYARQWQERWTMVRTLLADTQTGGPGPGASVATPGGRGIPAR